MIRLLLRLMSLLVPAAGRPRWREEWLAELECVTASRGRARALRVAAGALPDALATRRIAAEGRRQRGPHAGVFHALDQDIRYACRGLVKAPGFSCGVIFSLAIGIGANAAAFSFINAAVFRPFPGVRDQHELVRIVVGGPSPQPVASVGTTFREFLTMREAMTTIDGLSALREAAFAVFHDGQASSETGGLVTANYFDVIGLRPVAGRFFVGEEEGDGGMRPVVVIAEPLAERLYGQPATAIGQSLMVNGATLEIVGVVPREFVGLRKSSRRSPAVWVPLGMAALAVRDRDGKPSTLDRAGRLWFDFVGRRRPGTTFEQVVAQGTLLPAQLDGTRGNGQARATVSRVWVNDPSKAAPAIIGFMAVPMLVLAIACVNAANLVLARSGRHVRDWTVRLAVGATPWRVVRQVLAEALLLSLAATALGLLLTRWALLAIVMDVPLPMPIDFRVALFTVVVAIVTAVTFSLGPALAVTSRATRRLASAAPVGARSGRSRTRFVLVAVQAALSLGLLATGTQFARTVYTAVAQPHIPAPERLVMMSFDLDPLRMDAQAGALYFRTVLERARAVPGVASAGLSTIGLVTGAIGREGSVRIWTADTPPAGKVTIGFHLSAGCLDAIDVPLLQGRRFTAADEGVLRSVVVNRRFAEAFFQGRAVGRTFRLGPSRGTEATAQEVTVVGVVAGMMKRDELEPPMIYYPAALDFHAARTMYLRLDRSGTFTAAALQAALKEADRRVPLREAITLQENWQRGNSELIFLMRAVAILGVLGLVLAAGGLYSVVAYVVSLRRQEMGIRVALGADSGTLVTMVVRQALIPTLSGAAVGAAGAAATGMIVKSRIYGASSADPVAFGASLLAMVGVMLLASWLPARQAGRVNPVQVLRQE